MEIPCTVPSAASARGLLAKSADPCVERWQTGTFARAEQLIAQRRYREAIAFCRQELAAAPRSVTLRLWLARALLADGAGAAGVAQLEECVRIDPSAAEPRAMLAELGVEPPLPAPRATAAPRANRPPSIAPLPPPPSVSPLRAVPPRAAARPMPARAAAPVARAVAPVARAVAPAARPSVAPIARASVAPIARASVAPVARASVAPIARASVAPMARASAAPLAAIAPSPRVVYATAPEAAPLPPAPLTFAPSLAPSLAPVVETRDVALPAVDPLRLQPLEERGPEPLRFAHDPPGKQRQRVRRRRSFSSPFVGTPQASLAASRWERPLSIEQRKPQPLLRLGLIAIGIAGLLALWRLGRDEAARLPTVAVAPAARPTPEPPIAKPAAPTPPAPSLDGTLAGDIWIHPLAGPERRMPERDSRLFGAERVGDRPEECRGGHCGVDLAGAYGEPVYAVHDGVVDRVQRALNPDHGGRYVRLAHRDGTIITQYFHLSEIPKKIVEGAHVKVGDVVGFVGLTGVKHSAPHLHFTIEVQNPMGEEARYLDPEPLIALWPLRVSSKGDDRLHVSTAPPGLARGFLRKRKHHHAAVAAD